MICSGLRSYHPFNEVFMNNFQQVLVLTLFLFVISLFPVSEFPLAPGVSVAFAASGAGKETREAVFRFFKSTPSKYKEATKPDTTEKIMRLTFPVQGGDVTGTYEIHIRSDYSMGRMHIDTAYRFKGTFSGGNGGEIIGYMTSAKDNKRDPDPVTGRLWAAGWGDLKWTTSTYKVEFPPFQGECCNKNLNAYSAAVRGLLEKELLNLAVTHLHRELVKLLEAGIRVGLNAAGKLRANVRSAAWNLANKVSPIEMKYADAAPRPGFLEKMEVAFDESRKARSSGPVSGLILEMVKTADTCLSLLQVLDAASQGSYGEAGMVAAAEAIGAWSNMAGLAIVIGQAAKQDWDSFCQRNFEEQFRSFYRKVYYQGSALPSEGFQRSGQQARLQGFMEECMDWLGDGIGGSQSAQFRKMLIDFASYRLGLSKSRDDFNVVTRRGRKVIENRADAAVLAALFQAYEQVFFMEIQAERLRKQAMSGTKAQKEALRKIGDALFSAQRGDFTKVWEKGEFAKVFCPLYHRLEKEGRIKAAEKGNGGE